MAANAAASAGPAMEAAVECEKFLQLEAFLATEEFLERLIVEHNNAKPAAAAEPQPTDPLQRRESLEAHIEHAISTNITDGVPHKLPAGATTFSIEQPPTAAAAAAAASTPMQASELSAADLAPMAAAADPDGFVVIDRQAAVDAMAFYIAESLMRCPQAFTMTPKKLQEAVLTAVQGMKQSRFRQLCRQGVYAYRWGAIGYSAFQVYTNPWLCQAIMAALVGYCRLAMAIR